MATTLYRPYVTLNDVKFNCGIDEHKDAHDEDIRKAINKASRIVDDLTGRFYYDKTYTDYYVSPVSVGVCDWANVRATNHGILFSPCGMPLISVTSIYEDDNLLVENTDYYLDSSRGAIFKSGGSWTTQPRAIKLTANVGYESDDTETPSASLPGDIAYHAMEIASRFSGHYKKTVKNYVSGQSELVDLYGVPKDTQNYLMKLRPVLIL